MVKDRVKKGGGITEWRADCSGHECGDCLAQSFLRTLNSEEWSVVVTEGSSMAKNPIQSRFHPVSVPPDPPLILGPLWAS